MNYGFLLKTATLYSIVDVGAGKLGGKIFTQGEKAGFKATISQLLGEVTSNAAAAPVNTIIQAATEKKNNL